MAIIADKIIQLLQSADTVHIYGLSEKGNLYKIDPVVKKTWELVQYAPQMEVKDNESKKGK